MIATSTPTLKSRLPRKRLHELDRKEGPAIPAKLRLCVYSDYTIVNVIDKSAVISFAVCIFVRQKMTNSENEQVVLSDCMLGLWVCS